MCKRRERLSLTTYFMKIKAFCYMLFFLDKKRAEKSRLRKMIHKKLRLLRFARNDGEEISRQGSFFFCHRVVTPGSRLWSLLINSYLSFDKTPLFQPTGRMTVIHWRSWDCRSSLAILPQAGCLWYTEEAEIAAALGLAMTREVRGVMTFINGLWNCKSAYCITVS